ncbi:MAG: hypothetical protein RLZZ450_2731 [Pseudomonadota bacterium]
MLVEIDTDAHLSGGLLTNRDVSPDSAIDTLTVTALDAADGVYAEQTFAVLDAANWPVSFAAIAGAETRQVRLRLRAFQGRLAGRANARTLEPLAQVTIDRLAFISVPDRGVDRARVMLSMDCLGERPQLGTAPRTCVDGSRRAVDPREGVQFNTSSQLSSVGSWPAARARPCERQPNADQVCIPGGFGVLGDVDAVGYAEWSYSEPAPLRPVILSPFFLDRTEFTVGRLRKLLQSGLRLDALPYPKNDSHPTNKFCTWLDENNSAHDALPLNCVKLELASQICMQLGGALPTEAQWEYAARGRGEGRNYPWGDELPDCCALSAGRGATGVDSLLPCGPGIEPVGSHSSTGTCALIDVSRDGVQDLAGSLSEATRDHFVGYAEPCWSQAAILRDPVCDAQNISTYTARGSYWNARLPPNALTTRSSYINDVTSGFRCAYPAL